MILAGNAAMGEAGKGLPEGSGHFVFEDIADNPGKPIRVWYHRPAGDLAALRVVVLLHGMVRDAEAYRDRWVGQAEDKRLLVLAPEFSRRHFPGPWRYTIGNLFHPTGEPVAESQWTPTLIEKIFDRSRECHGVVAETYDLFGHSAGAQLAHRMVLFKPGNRIRTAIAANAGWYTVPDDCIEFPYGLAGTGMDETRLRQAFATRLTVLLGTADTNPTHRTLLRRPGALAQGVTRFERGKNFFAQAKVKAAAIGAPFAWTLAYADGVSHDSAGMAAFAATILVARP